MTDKKGTHICIGSSPGCQDLVASNFEASDFEASSTKKPQLSISAAATSTATDGSSGLSPSEM